MSDKKHKPWCSERARKENGGCICETASSFAAPVGSAAAWINKQSELLICVRTMLVGPVVVIREGHHVIGTGETLEEAVAAAIKKQPNEKSQR